MLIYNKHRMARQRPISGRALQYVKQDLCELWQLLALKNLNL